MLKISLSLLLSIFIMVAATSSVRAQETLFLTPGISDSMKGQPTFIPIYGIAATVDEVSLTVRVDPSRFEYFRTDLSPTAPSGWNIQSSYNSGSVSINLSGPGWRPQGDPIVSVLGGMKPDTFTGPMNVSLANVEASFQGQPINVNYSSQGRVNVIDRCLTLEFELEGTRSAPGGYEFPLIVKYVHQYHNFSGQTTVNAYHHNSNRSRAEICGLIFGLYELEIKDPRSVGNLNEFVALSKNNTFQLMGTLKGGDVTNDNRVDIRDYSVILSSFGTVPGDFYWDSRGDLNRDNVVDVLDYAMVIHNFGLYGPVVLDPEELQGETVQSHVFTAPPGQTCKALLIYGWHSGLGGRVITSYWPPDGGDLQTYALRLNATLPFWWGGEPFFSLVNVASPGSVSTGIIAYRLGVHEGSDHWFRCE